MRLKIIVAISLSFIAARYFNVHAANEATKASICVSPDAGYGTESDDFGILDTSGDFEQWRLQVYNIPLHKIYQKL